MSLRPRYSLLMLLILTALVAGGVKLWYGPHHVVERPKPEVEVEYTYTRDWQGNIIIHGPHIERRHDSAGSLESVKVHYYIKGVKTDHKQVILVLSGMEVGSSAEYGGSEPLALPPADNADFQATIKQEMDQIKNRGLVPILTKYHYYEHRYEDVELWEALD